MAKKTTDEELNQWHFRYPSAGVSWNLSGDPAYCQRFVGEAKVMLYRIKNRMDIAVPKLKTLEDSHRFEDGTVVTVKSSFGQDSITINASQALAGMAQCSITFINFPLSVPPMKDPGIITGVEGIDYFKTYYKVFLQGCRECSIEWNLCLDQLCRPFYFAAPLPYHVYPEGSETKNDPDNHCQYTSLMCMAEILERGTDGGGTYIIWKAYTEGSNVDPYSVIYSRDGLAWMKMRAKIEDKNGSEVCFAEAIIKVDCCLKPTVERPVIIHWEKCDLVGEWCAAPEGTSINDLLFFWKYGGWINMALRTTVPSTKQFGCLPFEWTLEGPGELKKYSLTNLVDYQITASDFYSLGCSTPVKITVIDRCGTRDSIRFAPCCESVKNPLSLNYTSLLMSCSGSQTLTASGGCPPYEWASTFGSIEVVEESGGTVIFAAPPTNANCASNPTVTVVDCCGESQNISLAVNCYTGSTVAISEGDQNLCDTGCTDPPDCYPYWPGETKCFKPHFCTHYYDCNGNYLSTTHYRYTGTWHCYDTYDHLCECVGDEIVGASHTGVDVDTNCNCLKYANCTIGYDCLSKVDRRTAPMKAAGCCPLNPWTGLPY